VIFEVQDGKKGKNAVNVKKQSWYRFRRTAWERHA
jgi:hypothetical protein